MYKKATFKLSKFWGRLQKWSWSDYGIDSVGMRAYRNNLFAGDFDLDIKDELLGFNSWSTKFDFDDGKFTWNWSTGNSGILSDWNILPSTNRYSFVKTFRHSPDQLLAFRKENMNYQANMYSFNEEESCPKMAVSGNNNSSNNSEILLVDFKENTDVFVHPNPTSGQVYISSRPNSDKITLIGIYNVNGILMKLIKPNEFQSAEFFELNIEDLADGIYFVQVLMNDSKVSKKIIKVKN